MNRVILMGRLTRDPEVRYSSGERSIAIARYTLAVDRRGRRDQNSNQPSADFIPCVAFDRAGEFAEKYFRQGQRVLVSGRIQTGSYTNRDGQKVYTTEVVVDDQEFADSKNSGNGGGGYDTQQAREQDYRNAGGQGAWPPQGGGAPRNQPYQGQGYGTQAPNGGGGYGGAQASQGHYQQQSMTDREGFMNIPDDVEDEGLPFN